MAERTPWWQMTRHSREGFWLGGLFALVAFLSWLWLPVEGRTFEVVLASIWSALAVGVLAGSLALRRRERADGSP